MTIATLMRNAMGKGVEALAAYNRKRLPIPEHPSPFLSGIHTPMSEELTLGELAVTGTIPPALKGRYLRIGPNPVAPDPASYHWFIGDGMVHGVAIEDGRALWYRNRWIRSDAVAAARGVAPAPGPRHEFDTVNTNVLTIGGRTYAAVEAGSYPVRLGETLDEQVFDNFGGTLQKSFTAHPHYDSLTREHHAICYEGRDPEQVRHVVIDAHGAVVREQPVAVKHGPMIHDCAFTARYVIILDLPVTLSMRALIGGAGFPYRWNANHPARVGLMPRRGTQEDIVWCPIPPAAVFHIANAYDDEAGRVVIDLCVYETMFDAGATDGRSRGLERWTIDPADKSVTMRTLDPAPQDFPRIDERRAGQRHRTIYSLALPDAQEARFVEPARLYALDVESGTRQVHAFGLGGHPGEFVFVPETSDAREGEGWLMGLVVDEPNDTTDLVIIDARQFEKPAVATIHIPHRVPPGFHGNWLPAMA